MRTSKKSESALACFLTRGPEQTRELAAALGKALGGTEIIHLRGGLGSGKTCFIQGLARGLGVRFPPVSPTFTLINEYPGSRPLIHVDLYRLEREREIGALGLEECFGRAVVAIEWAEKLPPELAAHSLEVVIETAGGSRRRICVRGLSSSASRAVGLLKGNLREHLYPLPRSR